MSTSKSTILLLGGKGKIGSRIAPLLSASGYNTLVASRSETSPSLPNCQGVKFDWFDESTYSVPFTAQPSIKAIYLIAPPIIDCFTPMKKFIDLSLQNGVKRLVLLSASVLDVADGPAMSQVSKYIADLGVEYAILRPTWFMENFSEPRFLLSIRDNNQIFTATGEGKLPFVSADDIAAVAYHALTDKVPHNTDHLILGPELLSYDDTAEIFTKALGRKITHVQITEDQVTKGMVQFGVPEDFARLLGGLDTVIKEGKEERLNDVVLKVTGREPKKLAEFVKSGVEKGVWDKKA